MKLSLDLKTVGKKLSYGDRIQPQRDWFIVLSLATFLIVLSIGWNLWLLRSVEQGRTIGNEQVSTAFDAKPIESVRAVFEARRLEELKYRQQYRFVDPSL